MNKLLRVPDSRPLRALAAMALTALCLMVMGAGVSKGHAIRVTADGPDEDDAITTLEAIIDGGMGEIIPG